MPRYRKREILVFGATGGTGAAIVRQALERGFGITIFARDTGRARQLFDGLAARLSIIEGDAANQHDVHNALAHKPEAVICSLGIYQRQSGHDELARATTHIIAAMQTAGCKRLVCISSLGVGDSRGQGDFVTRLIQKTALRHTLADKEQQEQALRDSALDWTVIRPTRLLNDGGPPHYQWWIGKQPAQKIPWSINRSQVAELALNCLDEPDTIKQALNVSGSLSRPQNAE
jgi:uncharacterized protein YbjT (DUF2867 family)